MVQPFETIHGLLDNEEQRARRLLALAPIQAGLAALVLTLSMLNLFTSVLDTLHEPLPGIGYLIILSAALCGGRLGYGVYREAERTAAQIICGAQASALIRLNARL